MKTSRKRKNPLKKENQHPEIKKKVDFSFSSGSNLYIEGNSMSKSAALQKMYDNYYNNLKKGVTLEELSENLNLDEQKSVETAKTRTIIVFNEEEEGEE